MELDWLEQYLVLQEAIKSSGAEDEAEDQNAAWNENSGGRG